MNPEDIRTLLEFVSAECAGPKSASVIEGEFTAFAQRFGWSAAAASLLPKLVLALPEEYARPDNPRTAESAMDSFPRSEFCDELTDALMEGNDAEVCRLIVEAVKAVRRAGK